jgi:hypothetical protein
VVAKGQQKNWIDLGVKLTLPGGDEIEVARRTREDRNRFLRIRLLREQLDGERKQ